MSRLQRFPLMTSEQILDSPSVRDGVPAAMEAKRHKIAIRHMMTTAANFRMSIFACAIGVILYRRFYTRRSLKRNSQYIVCAACLFLAGKVNDEPRSHAELAAELLKVWYGRPPARERLAHDPDWTSQLFATVLAGERVLLHTVGFDFNIDLVHSRLLALLRSPTHAHLRAVPDFTQLAMSTCNDVLRHDSALLLEAGAGELALAVLYFCVKVYRNSGRDVSALPLDEPEEDAAGCPWFVTQGLSQKRCQEITTRFMERLYHQVDVPGGGGGGGNDADSTNAAPSTQAAPRSPSGIYPARSQASAGSVPFPAAQHDATSRPDGWDGAPVAAIPRVAAPPASEGLGKSARSPELEPDREMHDGPSPNRESSPEEGEL